MDVMSFLPPQRDTIIFGFLVGPRKLQFDGRSKRQGHFGSTSARPTRRATNAGTTCRLHHEALASSILVENSAHPRDVCLRLLRGVGGDEEAGSQSTLGASSKRWW